MPSGVNSRRDLLGPHQRHILLDQAGLGLGQDALEVLARQRLQLHADGQTPLELGQEIGGFRLMEGARGNEQDVVGFDRAVLGRNGRAFEQRQQIALDAFARNVGRPP